MPAVGPGSSSIEELDKVLLDDSCVSVEAVGSAFACVAVSLGVSSIALLVADGSGAVSKSLPGAGALVQEVSETKADMPSAAARRFLVVSDHSRFRISLLFSIFIVHSRYHIIYTIF